MWVRPITLSGRIVRLEPLRAEHAPGLLAAAEPELFRFSPQAPAQWSIDGFRADIEKVNAMRDVVGFAVVHQARNQVIGRTTYMDIREAHRGLEIGRTWIARAHHGTAVNPEMKYLMLRHAFEELDAIRVQLLTALENLHSQRAIAKLGAVREGVMRHHMVLPDGRYRDSVVFSITSSEWPGVKERLETRLSSLPHSC